VEILSLALGAGDEIAGGSEFLTLAEIQRRLRALSDELDRLDQDPHIIARAFHTFVARSAYEALLAAASSRTSDSGAHDSQAAGPTFELELARSYTAAREVLEF
jgi:hypothetical protein